MTPRWGPKKVVWVEPVTISAAEAVPSFTSATIGSVGATGSSCVR